MRMLNRTLIVLILFAVTEVAQAALPAPAIDLDANTLPYGDVLQWINSNSCGYGLARKKFIAAGQPPLCEKVAGQWAVTFNGANGFVSQYGADGVPWSLPAEFSGANPWTVSYTVYTSGVGPNEWLFGWTHLNTASGSSAFFGYGSDDLCGVASHGGAGSDMGFDRGVPPAGGWHTITVTYSGASGWEKVYVDGALNAIEKKPAGQRLNIVNGGPVYLGLSDGPSAADNFSGSLAKLQVYGVEASTSEVRMLENLPPMGYPIVPNVPALVNPSFELVQGDLRIIPSGSSAKSMGDNRTIPGWAWAPADGCTGNSPRRPGIAINVPNRGKADGGGYWDNGVNADGTRVLALTGTTTEGQTISQYVLLKQGIRYHLRIHYNAATTEQPSMNVTLGGASLPGLPMAVDAVEGPWAWTKPFRIYEGDITATTTGLTELQICQEKPGTSNVLLVDQVEIFESQPAQPVSLPASLDFGPIEKGWLRDRVLHVQNMGSATLHLVGYSHTPVNGDDSARVDFIDPTKPGRSGGQPTIAIKSYQSTDLHLRFSAGTATRKYSGRLTLDYGNGTTSGTWTLPWSALVPSSPTLVNGSFELPYNGNELQPGTAWYNNYGGNVAIPGWLDNQTTQGIGTGAETNPMINHDALPDGRQALWIQCMAPETAASGTWYGGNSRSISQTIPGFVAGHHYRIVLYVNVAPGGLNGLAYFQLKLNGRVLTPVNYPSGATGLKTYNGIANVTQVMRIYGMWMRMEYDYTQGPSDGANTLELAAIDNLNGEAILNVDHIKIYDMASAPTGRVCDTVGYGGGIAIPIDFGTGTSGGDTAFANTKALRLYNEGGTTLTLAGMGITGPNARAFTLGTPLPSGGAQIAGAGKAYDIRIKFTPKLMDGGGIGSAYLTLATNDTTKTTSIPLYGVARNFPVLDNPSFQTPPAYFDDTGTIWRCLGTALNPAGWTLTSGLTRDLPIRDNFGACRINVNDQIGVCTPLNDAYQRGFYADNGMMANSQVVYIHVDPKNGPGSSAGAPKGIMQVVNGFSSAGSTYHVSVRVNAAYVGPNNDHAVKGVIFHYQEPESPTWTDLTPPRDVYAVDQQYVYNTPYTVMEGDIKCTVPGAYKIELWVPQQNDESTLLVQYLATPLGWNAVEKTWSRYE